MRGWNLEERLALPLRTRLTRRKGRFPPVNPRLHPNHDPIHAGVARRFEVVSLFSATGTHSLLIS